MVSAKDKVTHWQFTTCEEIKHEQHCDNFGDGHCCNVQLIVTMGKKNKKAKSVAAETDSGMPRHVRREVLEIVNQLLDSEHLGLFR